MCYGLKSINLLNLQFVESKFISSVQSNWQLLAHWRRYPEVHRMFPQSIVSLSQQLGRSPQPGTHFVQSRVPGRCVRTYTSVSRGSSTRPKLMAAAFHARGDFQSPRPPEGRHAPLPPFARSASWIPTGAETSPRNGDVQRVGRHNNLLHDLHHIHARFWSPLLYSDIVRQLRRFGRQHQNTASLQPGNGDALYQARH